MLCVKKILLITAMLLLAPAGHASSDLNQLSNAFEVAWQTVGGPPPPIGIALVALTETDRTTLGIVDGRGVRITEVASGGIADRLGIKVNDIVVAFNGVSVRSPEELVAAVRARDPSSTPNFELYSRSVNAAPQTSGQSTGGSNTGVIDCGPNPTVECAMNMLRDSWLKLREAIK